MSETASHLLARIQCRNSRNENEVLKDMERIVYIFFAPLKMKQFKPVVYSLVNESLIFKNPNEELQKDYPKVIVIDCRQTFKEHEFYSIYPDHKCDRSTIAIYRPTCEGSLIAHTQSIIKQNLAENISLKLILVIAPSSNIYRNVAQKFDRILHRTPIMCKIIFLWDSIDKDQILAVNRREISQAYNVETNIINDNFEIKYNVLFTGTKNSKTPNTHELSFIFPKK